MNKKITDKELFGIESKLIEFKKENPFSVPSGYFEELPQQIQQRLEKAPARKSIFIGIVKVPKLVWAGASLFLLIILGYSLFLNHKPEELTNVTNEFLFEDHLSWYSEYQPVAYYEMVLSDIDESEDLEVFEDLTDDQLTEYLLEYDEYFMLLMPEDYISEN
jgi:hypothetical protein